MTSPLPAAADPRECVVLLHGVALSGWVMRPIARALERDGYRVVNLSYPSRDVPLERLAADFLPASWSGTARSRRRGCIS
ncbi:esterase/lipase family protein [Oleiharenicola sp. Vm1]|uniref:esterase/lipase family protein n=1 Tax=Oleiharenicola sp. Vm1 TaxID=3398393 RepID=UPI0039F517A1